MKTSFRGFTLTELLIAVAIVGILGAIAVPSYRSSVMKSKRADAQTGLLKVQLSQEKWRASNDSYGTLTDLNLTSASTDGNYTIAVSGQSATGYTASATPISSQASDVCGTLSLTVSNGNTTFSSSGSTASMCWGR